MTRAALVVEQLLLLVTALGDAIKCFLLVPMDD